MTDVKVKVKEGRHGEGSEVREITMRTPPVVGAPLVLAGEMWLVLSATYVAERKRRRVAA